MERHKAGLHKEVATIFEGVWIPHIDNFQPALSKPASDFTTIIHPKPLSLHHWPEESKSARIVIKTQLAKRKAWEFFSPKARRERKRLSAISKHLLPNLPD